VKIPSVISNYSLAKVYLDFWMLVFFRYLADIKQIIQLELAFFGFWYFLVFGWYFANIEEMQQLEFASFFDFDILLISEQMQLEFASLLLVLVICGICTGV
jgi:hypothetical protein